MPMTFPKLLPEKRQSIRSQSSLLTCLTIMAILGMVSGCAQAPTNLVTANSTGFIGAVVADEPTAARIGRDMLARGGSAADAVVAMTFAQIVSLPTSVGLGGGGICAVFDPSANKAEIIDFSPRGTAGGRMGIPSLVRGIATLGAGYGKLGWSRQLEPAEAFARSGVQVSPALAAELAEPDSMARLDAVATPIYSSVGGVPLQEGALLLQPALAATIARLRSSGAGDFYRGVLAQRFIEGARSVGGDLTAEELRDYLPQSTLATRIDFGSVAVLLPALPSAGGALTTDVLGIALTRNYLGLDQPARVHLIAEATRRALTSETARRAGREPSDAGAPRVARLGQGFDVATASPASAIALPESATPSGSVIAALDRLGGGVACAFTQGLRFASGRLAGDTGVFVGPPVPSGGVVSLVPMIAADLANKRTVLVAGSTGGAMAPTGAAQLALGALAEARGLDALLERPRMAHDGTAVLLEDFGGDSALALEDRGHKLKVLPPTGRINAILCPAGVPAARAACDARPDPRGRGLGFSGE